MSRESEVPDETPTPTSEETSGVSGVNVLDIPLADRADYVLGKKVSGCEVLDKFLQNPQPLECIEVLKIRHSKTRRSYVEAALLTGASWEVVSVTLEIPEEYVELYATVFFDTRKMDRLDKVEAIDSCSDEHEKSLKLWAYTQGIDFLAWRLGKTVRVSPIEGLSVLFSDSYFKAKEAFFTGNSSKSSQEALKWTKQTVELGRLMKAWVNDGKEAIKDIEIALREITEDEMQFDLLDGLNLEEGEFVEEEIPLLSSLENK
jgi:hypothetical protein